MGSHSIEPSRSDVSDLALSKLSYEAAVRALDLQERAVEQLRARTGTLLAASSLTASFLGSQAIQRADGLGSLSALALLPLACSIGIGVYVLLPKRGLRFSPNGTEMYERLFGCSDEEMHRRLIYWLEEFWNTNQGEIENLGRYYLVAAIALIVQLAFWTWILLDRIS